MVNNVATRQQSFSLDKNLLLDAIVEAASDYIKDRAANDTSGDGFAGYFSQSNVVVAFEDEVDAYFNELEEELDNPEETSVDVVSVVDETDDEIVLQANVQFEENVPDDDTQDLADDLQAVPAVSAESSLLAVLNRLGLSVDKKNRILAIVGE